MPDTSKPIKSTPAAPTPENSPDAVVPTRKKADAERPALDPTRYGDWEKNGRCIDF